MNSHIIPAFVFRWLKDTSITGYLRAAENPKKRAQDGLKEPFLCAECEGRFNNWETLFANKIFYPISNSSELQIRYGDWLLKFCVSISWRILKYYSLKTGLESWSAEQQAEALLALECWRAFLFDEVRHPGQYEQHLLPLDAIESTSIEGMPDNINRYFMRAVDMDVAHGKKSALTYAKMGRIAIFGIITPSANKWEGTRISVKTGVIGPSKYTLPLELLDYLKDRALRAAQVNEGIPGHQLDKIEATILKNLDRARKSDQIKAMQNDEQMFGRQAILRKPKKGS